MFASEVVKERGMAWLQSDDRVSGDRPLRLVEENSFYRNPRADQVCGFFERSAKQACSRFRGVMS